MSETEHEQLIARVESFRSKISEIKATYQEDATLQLVETKNLTEKDLLAFERYIALLRDIIQKIESKTTHFQREILFFGRVAPMCTNPSFQDWMKNRVMVPVSNLQTFQEDNREEILRELKTELTYFS